MRVYWNNALRARAFRFRHPQLIMEGLQGVATRGRLAKTDEARAILRAVHTGLDMVLPPEMHSWLMGTD
jgi:hypothetical protein